MNWGYFIYRMFIDFVLISIVLFAMYNIFLGVFWNSAWARNVIRTRIRRRPQSIPSRKVPYHEYSGQGRDI